MKIKYLINTKSGSKGTKRYIIFKFMFFTALFRVTVFFKLTSLDVSCVTCSDRILPGRICAAKHGRFNLIQIPEKTGLLSHGKFDHVY